MSTKGTSTVTSTAALDAVIVAAGAYTTNVGHLVDDLYGEARKLSDPDLGLLSGGDGDQLTDATKQLMMGCDRLRQSTNDLIQVLDTNLGLTLRLQRGSHADKIDSAKKAANKTGMMAKS